jgi:hypothetical protein
MTGMNGWRVAEAFLVCVSTFIISFILTFAMYLGWEEWRYPGNSAQGDMSAFLLAVTISPVCAVVCTTISFRTTRSKYSK